MRYCAKTGEVGHFGYIVFTRFEQLGCLIEFILHKEMNGCFASKSLEFIVNLYNS